MKNTHNAILENQSPFSCRCCHGKLARPVAYLADMPLTDEFVSISDQGHTEYCRDIQIMQCKTCGIVQNPQDFDHETYYRDYEYSAGHSPFVQRFMSNFASVLIGHFTQVNHRLPLAVLEVGSGDGEQLLCFKHLELERLVGVEPSESLARVAFGKGIETHVGLFGPETVNEIEAGFDICLSSFTLDHVRDPVGYLDAAYGLLVDGGILAFEIHDLEKIVDRSEYCLFEHEHTIYLTSEDARRLVQSRGFEVLSVNPLAVDQVRGNSMILVARKMPALPERVAFNSTNLDDNLAQLDSTIVQLKERLAQWIGALPSSARLVGFGAGGRGVMTLAALPNYGRFVALFDSNYASDRFLTPKTRLPIVGPNQWAEYKDAYCLVFSFGYFDEIKGQLAACGFELARVVSLADFFEN
jgi:SAM-dependent methyltransferase